MKNFPKLDRFYLFLAIVLLIMAGVVIFTLQGIFGGLGKSSSIDPKLLKSDIVHVEGQKVESAYDSLEKKEFIPLDLR